MPKPQLPSGTALACLSAALPTEEGPPTEFRIFPKGKFDTQKGDYVFDDAAAASVIAASQEWGNEYSLDYEHAVLANPPAPAPAAGWFGLEAREDGLWAVNVRWTDKAAAHLAAREYRYFSPAFNFDHSSERRITSLINIGLTNTPAIRRLEPLMSASVRPSIDSRRNTVNRPIFLGGSKVGEDGVTEKRGRRFPEVVRERAVRMVRESEADSLSQWAALESNVPSEVSAILMTTHLPNRYSGF